MNLRNSNGIELRNFYFTTFHFGHVYSFSTRGPRDSVKRICRKTNL